MRLLLASLGFSVCSASGPLPSPAVTPHAAATAPPSTVRGEPIPQPPLSGLAARLDELATWLEGQPGVDRVSSWKNSEHHVWVRDEAGSTWCWKGKHCWTVPERPELISVLLGPFDSEVLRLAWGPENGVVVAWDFDVAGGQRRRVGELVARSSEPQPFWWAAGQAELSLPGKRWTMPATVPPQFMSLGFEFAGPPDPATASPTIAAPQWLPLLADLEIWPYRTSTGVVAFAVTSTAPGGSPVGTCVRLDRWRCALLDRLDRPVQGRGPVRAELVGPGAVAVEIAELDDLDFNVEHDELGHGGFLARAEVHVLAVDASAGRLAPVGALTVGGAVGTAVSLGMFRSTVDLDYRLVRRAYHPWNVVAGCIRVDALRGEDVTLDYDFDPLSDLLVQQWRFRAGRRLPKPRKPVAVGPEEARAVIARAAVLPPSSLAAAPGPEGAWLVTEGRLVRAAPGGCAP